VTTEIFKTQSRHFVITKFSDDKQRPYATFRKVLIILFLIMLANGERVIIDVLVKLQFEMTQSYLKNTIQLGICAA